MMQVSLVNDGPVTIVLDSKDTKQSSTPSPASGSDHLQEQIDAKVVRKQEAESRAARNADDRLKHTDAEKPSWSIRFLLVVLNFGVS